MTKPWAMARVASRRQLPKPRKMMGPVGRQIDAANNCMNDEEINRPTDKRIWFAMGECSCCRECGYHVCSCEPEDDNPGLELTDAELEKMARIGGLDGYFAVVRDRLGIVSGLNSVVRGAPKPDPEAQAEPKPFTEAFDQKIKTVMQSAELYLTAVNLGIDPSTLPGVETKPIEPKPEQIADMCMRKLRQHGFYK